MMRSAWGALKAAFRRMRHDGAAISPIMAIMLLPLSGAIAIAVEQGQWYYFLRSMQNAADAAAISAAINNTTGGYKAEAAATAAKFGYVNGTNHASVQTAVVTCPAGAPTGSTCYQASLSTVVPISLSALVGFKGNATYGSGYGQTIPVAAIAATSSAVGHSYCVWSLSTATTSFRSNGGPKPDLNGCSIMSNGDSTCTGHNLGATYGDAHGTNSGCGVTQTSGVPIPADPYSGLASKIPPNTCSSYPQETKSGGKWTVASSNQLSGSYAWTGNKQLCGDQQLTGNVTLTGSSTTIVIENGMLDTNGYTISTASGATATIIFSGTGGSYSHYPADNGGAGTLSIQAPTSGTWSGIAMYQDPSLTSGVDFTYAGNAPTWNLTGVVYLPKANLTFSGAVNKNANGSSCFALIAYTILVNGTANIFANNTGCSAAGATLPTSTSTTTTRLVA
ncbi:pilus assembly protein TadG-related protein [Sphingomonas oryzagri]|uniref:Pilus assembly protein TadG-related protein n=1 Tax=Sphingomonas oryzagri TaxID=3042314 RepID=A0ABT6MWA8_9SPHN|nr:pilus assembly protein TadG-related protein [Sphingomonas oryzagri]MDH7637320.1 pilus assembly protein TadG-related protein [Sphingomonas oryzagri]